MVNAFVELVLPKVRTQEMSVPDYRETLILYGVELGFSRHSERGTNMQLVWRYSQVVSV